MLSVNNLSLQYGSKHIFRDLSVQINKGDRVGLVGVNGTGKSTLLKIMAGEIEQDPGIVNRASWFTVSYLPQEMNFILKDHSLYEEAKAAFSDVLAWQEELEEIGKKLAACKQEDGELKELLARQGDLQHRLEGRDIFRMRADIEKILTGLGFSHSDLDRPVAEFSGGWLMRLLLAKLLLRKPALLLLDEPTNHLDIESLTWLEDFLLQYEGSMIIISHDRSFLDRVTNRTWELSLGKLTVYKGNYSFYLEDKKVRLELEKAAYDNQQALIKQTEQFITRFRAKSTKAKQVQSRVKQLEKMERLELSESERKVRFTFPPAAPCGRDVLSLQNISKSYGDKRVFSGLELDLQRGDKLAVVGVNGAGKSTLLKIIASQEKVDDGQVKLGHNVVLTYFGQHQARELAGELSVLDTVYHQGEELTITQARSLLGAFLFSGDEVDKKVQVLSGGEKSRVALAKMLVRPANLMLLDEPTNHLDITSQEVLQEAMGQYEGTIIVVSHNRFFVNSFVNKVLEIKDGKATVYEGNIDDYLEAKRIVDDNNNHANKLKTCQQNAGKEKKEDKKVLRQRRAELNRQLSPWKKQSKKAEQEIEQLEKKQENLEELMADPELYGNKEKWAEVSKDYDSIKRKLELSYAKWEEAQEKMEDLSREINIL